MNVLALKYIPGHTLYAILDGLSSNAMLFDGFSSLFSACICCVCTLVSVLKDLFEVIFRRPRGDSS